VQRAHAAGVPVGAPAAGVQRGPGPRLRLHPPFSSPPASDVAAGAVATGRRPAPTHRRFPLPPARPRAPRTRAQLIVATGKARGPWTPGVLPRLGPPMPGVFLQGLLVADAEGRTMLSR
jgi:hypothetical protein